MILFIEKFELNFSTISFCSILNSSFFIHCYKPFPVSHPELVMKWKFCLFSPLYCWKRERKIVLKVLERKNSWNIFPQKHWNIYYYFWILFNDTKQPFYVMIQYTEEFFSSLKSINFFLSSIDSYFHLLDSFFNPTRIGKSVFPRTKGK